MINLNYDCQPCANRLPCGICRLMQTQCPKYFEPCKVTWTSANGTNTQSSTTFTLNSEETK